MMWHDMGTYCPLVLGTMNLKRDYLVPIGHQIASGHCWDGASVGIQG
jgi:hypothetical protein